MSRLWTMVLIGGLLVGAGEAAGQATVAAGEILIETPAAWRQGARGLSVQRSEVMRVTGLTAHGSGIREVLVNDLPFVTHSLGDGTWRFDGFTPVAAGMDSVRIRVRTLGGEEFTEAYPVTIDLPGPGASVDDRWSAALSGSDFKGQRWAIVVGISEYQHAGIPPLSFAHQDAQQFADFLTSPRAGLGGFDRDNVMLLTNEQATYRALRRALFSFLQEGPTENDVVYIFWAGHGTPNPRRPQDLYLLPYDADPDDIASTGIPMTDLQDALSRTDARDKILFTDACHSAGVGFGDTRAVGVNEINTAFLDRLARASGGSVAITSSEANQLSFEGEEYGGGHGAFTYHMLEGLRGQADENADGLVDLGEVFEYVRANVRSSTRGAQTPTISQSSFNRAWPMAITDPAAVVSGPGPDEVPLDVSDSGPVGGPNPMSGPWVMSDSLTTFLGVNDTIAIRLNEVDGERLRGRSLSWRSSQPGIASVDGEGALTPRSPGITTVTASYFNQRSRDVVVRVYERPLQVEFSPREDTVEIVEGATVALSASMELPTGEIIQGVLPVFRVPNSLVVSPARDEAGRILGGQYQGTRDGVTEVTASLAGLEKTYTFVVRSPGLRIQGVPQILLSGDEVDVQAMYTNMDGTPLRPALAVSWSSTDSAVVQMRLGGITVGRPGTTQLIASVGSARDTLDVSVLGDLLISTEGADGERMYSYSMSSAELVRLGSETGTDPVLSPDGRSIAFVARREGDRGPRIYTMTADGTNVRRVAAEKTGFLASGRYFEGDPAWSHDGRFVYYSSNRDGNYDIYRTPVTYEGESPEPERIVRKGEVERSVSSAPDRPRLAFERVMDESDSDVILVLGDGSEEINFTADRLAIGSRTRAPREHSPHLLPGSLGLLLIEELPGVDYSPALARFDLTTRQRLAEIVPARGGQEVVYTASPVGDMIAYHQRPNSGQSEGRIVIVDLMGGALRTLTVPNRERILTLSWGAVPASAFQGGNR